MGIRASRLSPIGAEIVDVGVDTLLYDDDAPGAILDLLEANGVLLMRELGLDDEQLLALSRRLGDPVVRDTPGWSREHPGLYTVALDPSANADVYVKGTFYWHIDGTALETPHKASLLTGRVVSGSGGDTQFVSTYAAYDRLSDEEKARFEGVKVWHSSEAGTRRVDTHRTPEVLERLRSEPFRLHPLVWTHRSGRKSLVLGETASHVEGMPEEQGAKLLAELLERVTEPSLVYSHRWQVGDLVIWDNRGVLHRVVPYGADSGREMHRVTLAGDEPIA